MTAPSHSYQLFDRLFDATKDKLYAFVLKHTRDHHDTEDILQHCYLKLWEHLEKVDVARIDNLLFTYAKNAIIDRVRKKQHAIVLSVAAEEVGENKAADDLSPERKLVVKELKTAVSAIIDRLPPKRKQVFILVREQGMSYEEIAKVLGISKLTIKQHMHEALRFLVEEAGQHYASCLVVIFIAEQVAMFLQNS